MKIQLVSDLHMEFAPIDICNAGSDVLVLSGDIFVAEYFSRGADSPYRAKSDEWRSWMENVCAQFETVIYVLGNHEHYNGCFYDTAELLREAFVHISNLRILDNNDLKLRDYQVVGTTLWTDFDRDNRKAMMVQNGLNDYRLIKSEGYHKLRPIETQVYHDYAIKLIDAQCRDHEKVLVFGHHAPSYRSVVQEYRTGPYAHLNPGYASNLDRFIAERPQIKLWTHGHVHSSHDYVIGDTRVVANPRGYAKQNNPNDCENAQFDPNLVLEV